MQRGWNEYFALHSFRYAAFARLNNGVGGGKRRKRVLVRHRNRLTNVIHPDGSESFCEYCVFDGENLIGRTRHARRPCLKPIGAWQHGGCNRDRRDGSVDYEVVEEWADENGDAELQCGEEALMGFSRSTYEDYGWDYEAYLFEGTDENGNLSWGFGASQGVLSGVLFLRGEDQS